ncbi:MAG: dipeptide/oligopeptide/nickel ABC transporter ATP-binding protein, partial [Saprospiraceae bacterium]|nr:dipeptide/oligopeptide/nickel ABC transporter ATP-binding protein [Saprospiraceae bacterium]
MTGTDRPLLRVEGISKTFVSRSGLRVPAVRGVSFDLYPGQCVGLVGATGCGKSTIGRILAGLTPSDEGRIMYQSEDMNDRLDPAFHKAIQLVFQDPYSALYPHLRVQQYLREAIRLHALCPPGEEDDLITHLLERVGLPAEYAGKYPDELSGGERQRVQIARAVGIQPKLLICDESVSGLDVSVQARILGLLREICNQSGLAILFISHDLAVVRCIADDLLVMDQGRIV